MQGIGLLRRARACRGAAKRRARRGGGLAAAASPGIRTSAEGGLGAAAAEGGPLGAACPDAASVGLCVEAGGRCVDDAPTGTYWQCSSARGSASPGGRRSCGSPSGPSRPSPSGDWLAAPAGTAKAKEGPAAERHGSDAPPSARTRRRRARKHRVSRRCERL